MHDIAYAYPVTTMPWLRFLGDDQEFSATT